MQLPVVIQPPSALEVEEIFRNNIIIASCFKLEYGAELSQTDKHMVLRQFPYAVISEETKEYWKTEITKQYVQMPLSCYDPTQFNYHQEHKFQSENKNDDWNNSVPDDQIVYLKFSKEKSVGCQHYITKCEQFCKICENYYVCRYCHNEAEDHTFNQKEMNTIRCIYCKTEQVVGTNCIKCGVQFAKYFCSICNIFCDMGPDTKPNFHCDGCGCCMVGYREDTTHCYSCDSCIDSYLFEKHRCKKIEGMCPVCQDQMAKSMHSVIQLECGHFLHEHCYETLLESEITTCPICRKFLPVQQYRKQYLDGYNCIYPQVLVDALSLQYVKMHCLECGLKFSTIFNDLELFKCPKCGFFNSERLDENDQEKLKTEYLELIAQFGSSFCMRVVTFPEIIQECQNRFTADQVANLHDSIDLTNITDLLVKALNTNLTVNQKQDFDAFQQLLRTLLFEGIEAEEFEEELSFEDESEAE